MPGSISLDRLDKPRADEKAWPSADLMHVLVGCLFGGAATAVICAPLLVHGNVPGDLGDARFNVYVLEHLFRWLSGLDHSLTQPGLFYPYPDTLFFSDTHVGTGLIYALFRLLGAPPLTAFVLWFSTGFILTYAAAHYALARMGASPIAAGFGAVVFAFSLPVLVQFGHCQLVYRCGVPLAMLHLWRALRQGSIRDLLASGLWLCIQMLIGVYLGVFLFMLMAAFAVAWMLLAWCKGELGAPLRGLALDLVRLLRSPRRGDLALLVVALAALAGAGALLWGHGHTSHIYMLTRPWIEIDSGLPRVRSYIAMDNLPYWSHASHALTRHLPLRNEQQLFMGFGAGLLFLAGLVTLALRPSLARELPVGAMLIALALLVVATISVKGYTLYPIFLHLPGLGAIRSVSRIGVVLMYPVVVIALPGVRGLAEGMKPAFLGRIAATLCVALAAFEIATMSLPVFAASESEQRVDAIVAEALEARGAIAHPILAVIEQGGDLTGIDGELAAQKLGWPTVNGYSGYVPPGSSSAASCGSVLSHYGGYLEWSEQRRIAPPTFQDLLQRTVYVGWPRCQPILSSLGPLHVDLGKLPDDDLPKHVELRTDGVQRDGGRVAFSVLIHNRGGETIPAFSAAPIKLSWRFVPDGGGWEDGGPDKSSREPIGSDIPPGGEQRLTIGADLPTQPGRYQLTVSLVAEGHYWFHDKGMPLLVFPDRITVP